MDWSDHAMWWPEKNIWLDKTRWTLDQYNVTADAFLHFTPMHKMLRIQLPDLRYIDCSINFSIKTFNTVINLCNELGIKISEMFYNKGGQRWARGPLLARLSCWNGPQRLF
jgi:kindlin 2